jgi:hypothetical protein
MADFFTRLSARTLGLAPIASPRRPPAYAATPDLPDVHLEVPASPVESDAPFPAPTKIPMAPRPDRREQTPAPPRATAQAPDPAHPLVPRAVGRPADAPRADAPVPAQPPADTGPFAVPHQPVPDRPAAPAVTAARAPAPVQNDPGAQVRPPIETTLPPPATAAPASRPRAEGRSLRRELPQRAAEPAPTIAVTIGRVEVRAVMPPAPAKPAPPRSTLRSLDDYLKPQRRN